MEPKATENPSFDIAYPEIAREVRKGVRRLRMAHARELEEVLQEALIAVAEAWSGHDPDLPLRPWVAAIVRRVAGPRIAGAGPGAPEPSLDHQALSPEEQACVEQRRARLIELLRPVNEDLRIVFLLKELDGFTMSEIAEMLGVSLDAAHARLRSAQREIEARVRRTGQGGGDVAAWLGGPGRAKRGRMLFS